MSKVSKKRMPTNQNSDQSSQKQGFQELCRKGEKADGLVKAGKPREALKVYLAMVDELEKSGEMDSYLSGKLTLGLLHCHVKLGDFKSAFTIWNAGLEDSVYGVGIYALESAQTSVQDMVTYDMLCAFLHTLAESEKKDAALAVNQYLSRVCEQAIEDGERSLANLALSNWKNHLRELFGNTIPIEYAKPLIHFEKIFGQTVKLSSVDFPTPASWNRPKNFREMSYVSDLQALREGHASSSTAKAKKRSAS